ncbi:hypothetical protein EDF38_0195 [Frigoribacterium sp. PhB160]|uniref:hypothetical protein n=1 Tax=Frigoribacterium sp. PhB160 TaxID=2485192 RepID=UPI000F4AC02A|nr:hypothetical protein [Frigoribacterium sp. PhB160]ROS61112.1 hypothetical protein EDF38_0195 [Frigoribacterium sp. PhB160]
MFEQPIRRRRYAGKFQEFVRTLDPVSRQNLARLLDDDDLTAADLQLTLSSNGLELGTTSINRIRADRREDREEAARAERAARRRQASTRA